MRGLGTIINAGAIVLGCALGTQLRRGLNDRLQDALMKACGLVTIFIGVTGVLTRMLVIEGGTLTSYGTMLLLASLILGSLAGELLNIEAWFDRIGEAIRKRFSRGGQDGRFVEGFVNASLTVCIGAMAIVGAIQDGISGDYSMLAAKAALDFIIVMVMASVYGAGTGFSALPVAAIQGGITIVAMLCGSFVSDAIVRDISLVGSALVFCVGINIAFGKKFRVGNMLPAVIVPIIWNLF